MQFEPDTKLQNLGAFIGYLFSYFLFTTILYLILTLTNNPPYSWPYLWSMLLTFIITIIGIAIKKLLR